MPVPVRDDKSVSVARQDPVSYRAGLLPVAISRLPIKALSGIPVHLRTNSCLEFRIYRVALAGLGIIRMQTGLPTVTVWPVGLRTPV